MATLNYEGRRFNPEHVDATVDALTIEEALQININSHPFTVSMRTPGDDEYLIRGILHSERVLTDTNYHPDIVLKKEHKRGIIKSVDLTVPSSKLGSGIDQKRSLLSVSSCGICGKTELEDPAYQGKQLSDSKKIDLDLITSLFDKMHSDQQAFHSSGGTHAAAAFTLQGDHLCTMEDIGRHNAVDKVVGYLLIHHQLSQAKIMTVSGRISYEIVIKCFHAGIPFLAAVSAPSSMAVDFAKKLGITLLAFCRDGRSTCYAHVHRMKSTIPITHKI